MSTIPRRVLVVSEGDSRDTVTSVMSHWAIDPVCCSCVGEARVRLASVRPSIIFCDEVLGDGTYRDLLRELSKSWKTRFVVISADSAREDTYSEAITLGAFDMIAAPCQRSDVQWIAIRAFEDELRHSGSRRRQKLVETSGSGSELNVNNISKGTSPGGQ